MSTHRPDRWATSNPNSLAGWVAAETLARAGVDFVVVCPGSRSTPLAIAFARHPAIEATSVLDERSAAFLALGHARRTGRPAVVVCTSGTAAANFLPAVVEAREGRVPLLVLTADRPPEMRECASGQAIRQVGIFGVQPLVAFDLPVPGEAGLPELLACWRQWFAFAAERARFPQPGPVHLNLPFRDPLPPDPEGPGLPPASLPDWERFFGASVATVAPRVVAPETSLPDPAARGVIVAGWQPVAADASDAWVADLAALARATGWPVLADGINDARGRADTIPGLVRAYDSFLRDPGTARALHPEVVLQVGGLPTSKVLRAWLSGSGAPTWVADDGLDRLDPLGVPTTRVPGGLAGLAAAWANQAPGSGPGPAWLASWLAADRRAAAMLDAALDASPKATECRVARTVFEAMPSGSLLVVANSMPVRDLEWFRPLDARGIRVVVNRGANGIDGTLSTAMGVAWGADVSAVLLTGDLAFLHDANGLLQAPRLRGSLTAVVVDNRGGGIFGHLPVARLDPPFEEFFATPQEVDLAALAAAHGVACREVADSNALRAVLAEGLGAPGMRLILWRADRRADAAWRKSTLAASGTPLASTDR